MKKITFLTAAILILTISCQTRSVEKATATQEKEISKTHNQDFLIQAVLWQEHAAEYRALSYQAYNTARWSLDKILERKSDYDKPLAVVTDIDETALNNSPYEGKLISTNKGYSPSTWKEWIDAAEAKPIPGALDFFNYAKSKEVEVFYITNRKVGSEKATLENLKNMGFPYADKAHLLLKKEGEKGKKARRDKIKETHNIVMLLGDNLSDFTAVFDAVGTKERNNVTDSLKELFGTKFIVLPNPMYGAWESNGIFEGKHWTDEQKDSVRNSKVIGY